MVETTANTDFRSDTQEHNSKVAFHSCCRPPVSTLGEAAEGEALISMLNSSSSSITKRHENFPVVHRAAAGDSPLCR